MRHKVSHDRDGFGRELQNLPLWVEELLSEDSELNRVYNENREFILRPHDVSEGRVTARYNFPVCEPVTSGDLASIIDRVYRYEPSAFK